MALAVILGSWVGLRVLLLATLAADGDAAIAPAPVARAPGRGAVPPVLARVAGGPGVGTGAGRQAFAALVDRSPAPPRSYARPYARAGPARTLAPPEAAGPLRQPVLPQTTWPQTTWPQTTWPQTGLAAPGIGLPDAGRLARASASVAPDAKAAPRPRWSGDGWLLLRDRADAASLGAGAAAYGGSQTGVVLRYALGPDAGGAASAYLRVTSALGGIVDRQAAAGVAWRPLRAVPLALAAEARVQQGASATRLRPAVLAVGGFGPRALAPGTEIEGYGQVGWVGGRQATPFFDLQASVLRRLTSADADRGPALGLGVWSGGQQGAARLDLGPRLEWRIAPGGVLPERLRLRVMVDWRVRVAGRAQPGSGPTLTLAGGF